MLLKIQRSLIYRPMQVAVIRPEDAGLPSGRVHAIAVPTHDGLTLNGWHALPHGRTAADPGECQRELDCGRPLILYFPGNSRNRTHRGFELRLLSDLGADVFLFDHRGYGDNPGRPTEEHLAADARSIWKYAVADRRVDPSRIVIFGESLGGGIAVRLAAELCRNGVEPAGLILRSTFNSLVDAGRFLYPMLPVRRLLRERFASEEHIPAVTCPILQFHGRLDRVVPFELGERLFAAAPETSRDGHPKRFIEIADADHSNLMRIAAERVLSVLREFTVLRGCSLPLSQAAPITVEPDSTDSWLRAGGTVQACRR